MSDMASYARSALDKVLDRASGDARLPKSARAKIVTINQDAEDAQAAYRRTYDASHELREQRGKLKLQVELLESSPRQNVDEKYDGEKWSREVRLSNEIVAERTKLGLVDAELARLAIVMRDQQEIATARRELASNLSEFVARLPRGTIAEAFSGGLVAAFKSTVTSVDAGSAAETIEQKRRRIRELTSDLDATRVAPMPSREAKQKMRDQVAALAERGEANVYGLISSGGAIEWPLATSRSAIYGEKENFLAVSTFPDALAIWAWTLPDSLIARLDRAIDEGTDDSTALTVEERARRIAEIEADILANSREEEALIEKIESSGVPVRRRPDADPRAVLGLASTVTVSA
jgi:hypothetical protein